MSDQQHPPSYKIHIASGTDVVTGEKADDKNGTSAHVTANDSVLPSVAIVTDSALRKADKEAVGVFQADASLLVSGGPESSSTVQSHVNEDRTDIAADMEVDEGQVSLPVNMVLNQNPNNRVVYFNSDGTIAYAPPELSSCGSENIPIIVESSSSTSSGVPTSDVPTLNSNYLVVVENIDGSQVLSTTMHGNLVLNPSDLPMAPQTQLSYTPMGNEGESSKLDKPLTNYPQQTITMVLDGSTHLSSKGILMDPNSFITYSDQPLSTDQLTVQSLDAGTGKPDTSAAVASTQHIYGTGDSSFIDISSLNVISSDSPSSGTVHHKPDSQSLSFSAQGTQTVLVQRDSMQQKAPKSYVQKSLQAGMDDTVSVSAHQPFDKDMGSEEQDLEEAEVEQEALRLARQKEEQRFLEQCHLAHHMQQIKQRQAHLSERKSPGVTNRREEEAELVDISDDMPYDEVLDINDETPIFTKISASVNSAVLAHLPGCQQFLLDQARNVTFESGDNCTFHGSLKSLVDLHNLLKRAISLRSRTLLQLKVERDRDQRYSVDKLTYNLVKPYVSLRGRRPKYSLKAAEMGYLTDIDAYLSADITDETNEKEPGKSASRRTRPLFQRKRKRGRCAGKKRGRKGKESNEPSQLDSVGGEKTETVVEREITDNVEVGDPVTTATEVTCDQTDEASAEASEVSSKVCQLGHPQKELQEVEETFSETVSKGTPQHLLAEEAGQENSLELQGLSQGEGDGEGAGVSVTESTQENPASDMGRETRMKSAKFYDRLHSEGKVHPRNPLTESAATKQQRKYEEKVSFKFFCKFCSYKTRRQSHFLSHMLCHRDGTEKLYNCKQCDFVTISVPMLRRHELKHKKNLFWCDLCAAYSTDRKALLRRHIRMKHGIEIGRLKCDQCRFTCDKPEVLARHTADHEHVVLLPKDGTNNCPDCKKSFRLRMHLKRHIRDVHGPELRPYLCDKCGKAFKRTDALQQHKLVHMSRTARSFPFKCTTCSKGFRSPAHLKEHMSMHSSERPFLCQYCGAAFKTPAVQKKHIMTLHIRPRTHVCSVCCRQFNTKHALQRHENTHVKPDAATEAAVSVIERENALAEKAALHEKSVTLTTGDNQTTSLSGADSATILVEGQISNCLAQDMIGTAAAAAAIEEPLEQSGQDIQQAYIQGTQDGTLYYFTGELPTL